MQTPLSRLRQRLWAEYRLLGRLLRRLQRPDPMTTGSLYLLRTRCGKPNCRCARGQFHTAWVLSRSEQGRRRLYSVPATHRPALRRLTAAYRRFQRARARWIKLTIQLRRQIDGIEQCRVQPWPTLTPKPKPPRSTP